MKIELLGSFGDDLMVANAARVSLDKYHDEFVDADARLIRYLAEHGHINPFFHPQVQLRITAPIFIARQWFRSTVGVARSEVSRRYVDSDPQFFVPDTWRARPEGSIKQGSGGDLDAVTQSKLTILYYNAVNECEMVYQSMLRQGVAPEQARMVLPQSMYTSWIETGSLAYWARVYKLRSDLHAQQEIQELARHLDTIIGQLFPISWRSLVLTNKQVYGEGTIQTEDNPCRCSR